MTATRQSGHSPFENEKDPVERLLAPKKVGQGDTTREVAEALLHVHTQAYEFALAPAAERHEPA